MLTNTGITIFNAFSDKKSKKIVYVPLTLTPYGFMRIRRQRL